MKKKILLFAILSLIMTFSVGLSSAKAADYSFNFKTNDGAWDGTIKVNKSNNVVLLHGLRTDQNVDETKMQVRLCNASTGNCTAYKYFASGEPGYHQSFENMKPATYRVDIRDPWSFSVSGSYNVWVNEW